jgi:hypothetical protein
MRSGMMVAAATLAALPAAGADAAAPMLAEPMQVMADGKPINVDIGHASPSLADVDGDGKPELLVGQFGDGKLRIYPNQGTASEPRFASFTWFKAGGAEGKVPSG